MSVRLAQAQPRFEDVRLIQGKGRYTDDLAPPDALRAVLVRSPHAHARIRRLSTDRAKAVPGILAVYGGDDYAADGNGVVPHAANPPDVHDVTLPWFRAPNASLVREWGQPPLAAERVRFVGEAVALVIGETLRCALDAADLVEVEYEPLPAVIDALEALGPAAPVLWDHAPDNLALAASLGDKDAVDAAFAKALIVIEHRFRNQRIVNCQMEPRAAFAQFDAREGYTITAGSQGVMRQRMCAAKALGVPLDRVRMISPDVGGGFGPRTPLNMEPVLVAWAACKLGRTVRWACERTEAFVSDFQARDQYTTIAVAFDAEGRILAQRSSQVFNLGAYPASFAPAGNGQRIVTTTYRVPHAWVETRGVLTNTVPTAPYRGAGRPEAHLAIERVLDMAAARLGMDRLDIRRRNVVTRAELPYRTPTDLRYDSGDFAANMEAVLKLGDWAGFETRRAQARRRGRFRGIAIANYVESPVGAPAESVTLSVSPEGRVMMIAGTQSTGQGHETTFVQIAAALLDVDCCDVDLRTGDTAFVQTGGGSHSDRSARLLGALLDAACPALLARAREAASLLTDSAPERLTYARGHFEDDRGRRIGLGEIADAFANGRLPSQLGSTLQVSETIAKRIPAHPTGSAVCEVEIDPETGHTDVVRYSSVDDVGQPINPLVVDGQVHGGIAQGVGQAVYEQLVLAREDGQVLSASYMDYCLPKGDDLPAYTVALAEDPTTVPANRLRIKGGGEGGITPALAVVMGAIADALRPLGIDDVEMPATPAKIWRLIADARTRNVLDRNEGSCR